MGERGRRRLCVTIVVMLLAAAAACSGGDDEDGEPEPSAAEDNSSRRTSTSASTEPAETTTPTTTATTAPATTTRPPTPEGQITVDYLAFWAAYDRLAADPGADVGVLAEHASGPALAGAQQEIEGLRSRGERVDPGPREKHNAHDPAVIDGQTGYVADCHVAEVRVVDAGGEVVRSDPVGGRPETIAVTLVRSGDRWLVDSLQYYDLAPGETCSASGPVAG